MDGSVGRLKRAAVHWIGDIQGFSRIVARKPLRPYQLDVARAILHSVEHRLGLTFAVVMARQAGKNETQAQLEAFLLNRYRSVPGAQIVKAAPTFQPQTLTSMMRLEGLLDTPWFAGQWRREHGHMIRLGQARILFFSAQPGANVVGATASLLLECDEAQDVDEEKWNKDFRPMAAATNATTVLWGTMWTSRTLLSKTIRALRRQEAWDGMQRVFLVPWERAAEANPAYGVYVRGEIERLGRQHPLIKTQYALEEIDAEARMFPPHRQAQMRGSHPRRYTPEPGRRYALLIDVAGETEEALQGAALRQREPRRDSTALTVVEIREQRDPLSLSLPPGRGEGTGGGWASGCQPVYHVVDRRLWTGTRHTELYATLRDLAGVWRAERVVVDATGIGAGLASFLAAALGERVVRFVFSARTKSDLGWGFLALVEAGRFKDYADDGLEDTRTFWRQVEAAEVEILDGPEKHMRWGVPDPRLHDDLLISAALCATLEAQDWSFYSPAAVVEAAPVNWEGGGF